MNRLPLSFFPAQKATEPEHKDIPSTAPGRLPLTLARVRALNHIHDAAEIIRDVLPDVAEVDRQLYATIVGDLFELEQHLAELNQS
jgi:hypothetical protein